MPPSRRRLALCVLLLGACGCVPRAPRPEPANGQPPSAATRGEARSLFAPSWVWSDEQGLPARFVQWRGTPIIVTMFFTGCTSTCPLTIDRLRRVTDTFEREGRPATFVLVTLDPSNDTPDQLRRFKVSRQLPGKWHLLQGNEAQTRQLADLLQIHVLDDAHVFHDARIVVFDQDGKLSGQVRG